MILFGHVRSLDQITYINKLIPPFKNAPTEKLDTYCICGLHHSISVAQHWFSLCPYNCS